MNLANSGTFANPITMTVFANPGAAVNAISSGTNTFSGVIAGTVYSSFNQNGTGVTVLTNANTYAGPTNILSGTLKLGQQNAAQLSPINIVNANSLVFGANTITIGGLNGSGSEALLNGGTGVALSLGNNSGLNCSYSGGLSGAGASLTKISSNAQTLSGNLTYTGATTVNGGLLALSGSNSYGGATTVTTGSLQLGANSPYAIPSASALNVNGGVFDLNGNNFTTTAMGAGNAAGTITDNSAVSGTTVLTISTTAPALAAPINDGANGRVLAVNVTNGNGAGNFAANSTFSGGVTLLAGSGNGTRLAYSGSGAGSPGAITSSQLGRGTLTIGLSGTDKAQLMIGSGSSVVLNNIVFNSALGTDVAAAIRVGGSNIVLAGTLTAGLADINVGTGNAIGTIALQGQLTGSNGLWIKNCGSYALTATLSNTTASVNNYLGNTTIDSIETLILGAADQIPDGSGKGSMALAGSFNLNGFSETINGLTGSGVVDGGSGAPVFTVGNANTTGTFSGAIKNTAGALSLVKAGAGTLTLTGSLTYAGSTTINGGTLALAPTASVSNTLAGNISGVGALSHGGSGLTVLSGSNSYGGGTLLNAGTLSIASDDNVGGSASALTFNGGVLQVTGLGITNLDSHAVNWSTFSGGIDVNSAANTFTISQSLSGTGSFTKAGAGTLVLSGSNSHSGTTVSAGLLQIGNASALGSTTAALSVSGSLDLNGYNVTVASLSGAGIIGNNAGSGSSILTLSSTSASSSTFGGSINDNLGNPGAVTALRVSPVWLGAGYPASPSVGGGLGFAWSSATTILTGLSSFTGVTTVNAGTVQLAGSNGMLGATSLLTVQGNASFIDGDSTAATNNGITDRVNNAASLQLGGVGGGGTFSVAAPAIGSTHSQSLASLTVGLGGNTISASGSTGTVSLAFTGAAGSVYSRNTGGILNIVTGTNFVPSFTYAPTGANVAGTGADAILTGAFLNNNDFISANSGTATAATYTNTVAGGTSLPANKNITVVAGNTTQTGDVTINSLRFNDTAQRTVTMASGTLTVASGGILAGSAMVTDGINHTLTGGAVTSGVGDLIINAASGTPGTTSRSNPVNGNPRNATYALTIASSIVDNGSPMALTVAGGAQVCLSGSNSYSGGTYLDNALVAINADSGFGAAAGAVTAVSGVNNIRLNNTFNFSSSRNFAVNAGAQLGIFVAGASTTLGGALSGAGQLLIGFVSAGNPLILTGNNSSFTGQYLTNTQFRADEGVGLSSNANLVLAGRVGFGLGVLETKGSFSRPLGVGAGQVQWSTPYGYSDGGFAAVGGALTVNIGGAGSQLTLGGNGFLTLNSQLVLQNGDADSALTWVNPINNNGATLTIWNGGTSVATQSTMTGALTGSGGLTVTRNASSGGLLILSATNSYGGTTTLNANTLRANDGTSLPSTGNLTISGAGVFETGVNFTRSLGSGAGQFQITGTNVSGFSAYGAPVTIALGGTATPTNLTWGSAMFVPTTLVLNEVSANNTLTFANAIDLSGSSGRTVNVNAATAIMTGALTGGTTSLTKGGAGTLVLATDETYAATSGSTTISSGTLQLGNGGAAGSVIGNITDNGTLAFNRSDSALVESGTISGSGAVVNAGGGTVTLAAVNSYSGATTLTGGTLSVSSLAVGGSNSGIGKSSNVATNLVFNGGSLLYTGATGTTDRLFSVGTGGGAIDSSGSGPLTFNNGGAVGFNSQTGARTLTLTGNNTGLNTVTAVLADNGGATSVTKNGTGTWAFAVSQSYSGDTSINAGTQQISNLYNSTVNLNGGSLSFGSQTNPAIGGLKGSGNLALSNTAGAAVTLTVGGNNQDTTYSGALSGSNSNLYKTGAGTLTLTGNNTYSGYTTIHSGAVTFTGSNSLGSSNFTLGDSATAATMTLAGSSSLTLPGSTTASTFAVTSVANGRSVLNIRDNAELKMPCLSGSGTTFGMSFSVGNGGAGASGAVFQSGGSVNIDQALYVGSAGAGYYSLTGGSIVVTGSVGNSAARFRVGGPASGSYGLLAIAGGTANVSGGVGFGIGVVDSATTGGAAGYGSIYVTGGALVSAANYLNIGNRFGQGDLTIAGSGVVNVFGNPTNIGSSDSNAVGILNLNGGSLQTSVVTTGSGGTSYVNFSGGTLKANSASATFMNGLTRATINGAYSSGGVSYAGGATIDTNGSAVTIGQSLLAPTGDGVAVAGFTPIAGLIGAPFVQVTGGGGTGATAQAIFDPSTGTVTGITVTNPGVGYTGTPTFQLVGGGLTGTSITATTVANTSGGLTKTGAGTLTLTGNNTFGGDTVVNSGTLAFGNANALSQSTLNYDNQGGKLSFGSLTAVNLGGLNGAQNLALVNTSGSAVALTVGGNNQSTTFSGDLTGPNSTLIKSGTGTLTLSGSVGIGDLTANSGILQVTQSGTLGTLNIGAAGTFGITANGVNSAKVLDTSALSIAAGGTLDLWDNALILRDQTGGTNQGTNLSTVQGLVNTAFDNGAWDKPGITSSTVIADLGAYSVLTVMVYDNTVLGVDSFEGINNLQTDNGGNQVMLKTTYLGDFDGNGIVNSADYGWLDFYYGYGLTVGDLNGDGQVNSADYNGIDYGYGYQAYGVLAGGGQAAPAASAASASAPASPEAVPEPGTFGLLLTGLLGLLGHRRSRKSS